MATPREISSTLKAFDGNHTLIFEGRLEMVVSETHTLASEVTEHAVERGADITDHVRRKPARVNMQLFVSEEPLDELKTTAFKIPPPTDAPQTLQVGGASVTIPPRGDRGLAPPPIALLTPGGLVNAAVAAVSATFFPEQAVPATVGIPATKPYVTRFMDLLEEARNIGQVLTLVTRKRTYDNMLLESVTMDRGQGDGTGARFNLEFKEVRIVDTKIVPAPAGPPAAKSQINKGAQTAPEAPKPPVAEESFLAWGLSKLAKAP